MDNHDHPLTKAPASLESGTCRQRALGVDNGVLGDFGQRPLQVSTEQVKVPEPVPGNASRAAQPVKDEPGSRARKREWTTPRHRGHDQRRIALGGEVLGDLADVGLDSRRAPVSHERGYDDGGAPKLPPPAPPPRALCSQTSP
jgi:hypothetical protein